ncbi:MAG TPA: DUF1549 domain-containing protein [Gemmataceae bacterium]|nr:DUF1549 domain-containing protein [Gemmataceae bacterium]
MIRHSLGFTALAGAVLWALVPSSAPGQPPTGSQSKEDPTKGGVPPQSVRINEYINKGYEAAGIKKPAERSTDYEFLRRTFIDLVGRIATPEEVRDFERDQAPNKRAKLVQRLLYEEKYQPRNSSGQFFPDPSGKKGEFLKFDYTNAYAEHWADIWTVWLMTRTGHPTYREQMRVWLERQFIPTQSRPYLSHKDMVTKLLTATGTTGEDRASRGGNEDANAVNFIVHHLGDPVPAANRSTLGAFEAVPITSRVTRLFLGIQTQCTQCHDHPHNKQWLQADFWGVNAFFRQTVRSATPTMAPMGNQNAQAVAITLSDDSSLNPELIVYYERRDGRKIGSYPVMLKDLAQADNGQKSTKLLAEPVSGKTRRQQLAEWVIAHDNFAKAYVNRIWGHFFGRGLNKDAAVDDFGSHNELIHPELLAYLADEFMKAGYDPKKLMEWICCSDAYSLSHVANKNYVDPKYDAYFARMPLKAMSPEVLFDSLMTATRAEYRDKDPLVKQQKQTLRDAWMRKLVRNFGDDEGNELTFNGTVVQALLMMNGSELNGEIGAGAGRGGKLNPDNVVADVVKRHGSADGIYDELFLLTLNRHPTQAEKTLLNEVREGRAKITLGAPAPAAPGGKPKPAPTVTVPGGNDLSFYQDVFWALLNTNEFMLNH